MRAEPDSSSSVRPSKPPPAVGTGGHAVCVCVCVFGILPLSNQVFREQFMSLREKRNPTRPWAQKWTKKDGTSSTSPCRHFNLNLTCSSVLSTESLRHVAQLSCRKQGHFLPRKQSCFSNLAPSKEAGFFPSVSSSFFLYRGTQSPVTNLQDSKIAILPSWAADPEILSTLWTLSQSLLSESFPPKGDPLLEWQPRVSRERPHSWHAG